MQLPMMKRKERVTDLSLTPNLLKADIQRHLGYTLGKDEATASRYDWRMALSFAIRDRIVEPWFTSTRRTKGSMPSAVTRTL